MKGLQLSHKTNAYRIQELSNNMNDPLVQNLKNHKDLSLALGEPCDKGETTQFKLHACIILGDFQIYDKKLSICRLTNQTCNLDIFNFYIIQGRVLAGYWKKLLIIIDGATALSDQKFKFIDILEQETVFFIASFHCTIQMENICAQFFKAECEKHHGYSC